MLVNRRVYDSIAAISTGGGVVLIATGLKPVPAVIGYLGGVAYVWGLLMLGGSIAAAVGSLLRTRNENALRRRDWSVLLERAGWPVIGGCALVFCVGVVNQFGIVDAALTLGWSIFTISTCAGHWRDLRPPKETRHRET